VHVAEQSCREKQLQEAAVLARVARIQLLREKAKQKQKAPQFVVDNKLNRHDQTRP